MYLSSSTCSKSSDIRLFKISRAAFEENTSF